MAQSLSSILIHLVFSTKNRQPIIVSEIEPNLHAYMATVFHGCQSPSLLIGGTADHIHALFTLSRTRTLANLVEEVKTSSSKWMKTNGTAFRNFRWQSGYGAFSIGQSNVQQVKTYIAHQKEHHHRQTFQEELRSLLRKYEIQYEDRYIWD